MSSLDEGVFSLSTLMLFFTIRYHAIIADGSVMRAAAIHGCRAALFDDMDVGDGEEISRMCATGIFCALACSAADPHMAVAVRGCRTIGLQIVVWSITNNFIIM